MYNLDPYTFWEDSDYARESYVDDPLTDELILFVERELGYQLPKSYIELCRSQNGGIPRKTCHRTSSKTSWSEDHVAISGISAIGRNRVYSLCGQMGSKFMMAEWGYPPIGVYFGECPSAGHDMICLDYRAAALNKEPQVVHVDQELNYKITLLAKDFSTFIEGLQPDSEFGWN